MHNPHRSILAAPRRLAAIALVAAAGAAQAGGSLSVSREVEVDAAPATVWKLVGNFNHLDVWHPAVVASTQKGGIRTLTLAGGGGTIVEKRTALSDSKMSYSYVIQSGPLPVQQYASTLTVMTGAAGKSIVSWTGTFNAKGAPDDKAKEVIQGVYDAGLARVAANFKK
ncbi:MULTISPECIES: SRPBCC family protein [unclassified Methylibium]|uniref:SRPBCC family protein n=1 Tax=unclassified Methylibium TaxID=2633235 RepID=UPI0003F45CDE|nr:MULTISPECIES: SRPBCC family protein [unclassified Methylibium]AIA99126.1 Polyketide cyclase / dehydrase and lipid transport [Methylibium sp. T29]AIA99208.1 Polyketide cyclase / dehydrase and lipid transport [Methylibium sp. T29-B]EWS56318.1 Polyketide cyclase / dehydrase and lipid transport [Methylibium sp. T29]EWS60478.1 Polyketide cyclase / dehydrase and lipid transport [Methylibium sp. T29-B]